MTEPSPESKPLRRAAAALLILVATAIAVLWILGVAEIYDPDFNPKVRTGTLFLAGQTLVGLCGVLSLGASAWLGARYVSAAVGAQPGRAALLLLLAVSLGALWLFLAAVAASS